jgi:hypothetical protein
MFIAYNLRRLISIIGIEVLKEYMKNTISLLLNILRLIWLEISHFKKSKFIEIIEQAFFNHVLKRLIFG